MNMKNIADSIPRNRAQGMSTLAEFKEAMRTKNAKRLLFAVQFLFSFLSIFYFVGVVRFAYHSCFYRLEIAADETGLYGFLVTLACIGWGALMLFTRRQIVTRLVIMCSMPFYLPIVLFNYRYLCLIIPLGIFVLITYLASGTSEGPKTILGAVFLMVYVLGTFIFFVVQSIMQPATLETVVQRGISPEQTYRYSVVKVRDQANGNTYIAIEPNTYDISYNHSVWYAKGYTKEVYRLRPVADATLEWKTQTRAEITKELLKKNPNTVFTLNSEQMQILSLDKEYTRTVLAGDLTRSQRKKLGYCLERDLHGDQTPESAGLVLVTKDRELTLSFDECVTAGLTVTYDMRLSNMTDEDLAKLGVPEVNEVLSVNGKIAFRQYIAVLERSFVPEARELSAFLESNELPDIGEETGNEKEVVERERMNQQAATEETTTTTKETTTTEASTETTEATES